MENEKQRRNNRMKLVQFGLFAANFFMTSVSGAGIFGRNRFRRDDNSTENHGVEFDDSMSDAQINYIKSLMEEAQALQATRMFDDFVRM